LPRSGAERSRALPASPETIAQAGRLLAAGGLVAFPTETVYGLGADATNGDAIARLYRVKGRPARNPLIVHVADIAEARRIGAFDDRAERLAARFWPGPLTLVLERAPTCRIVPAASAGLSTIALRLPAQDVARAVIAATGKPIAAPSANRSGRVSPTDAAAVVAEFGDALDLVIDGGPSPVGIESTVLSLVGTPRLLRPGFVTAEAIEACIGKIEIGAEAGPLLAPGGLASHYAPALPLRLEARDARPGEAFIAFGKIAPADAAATLSAKGDLIEAAANLYATLRSVDRKPYRGIAVAPVPEIGIGVAINDRLRRAAAPRSQE